MKTFFAGLALMIVLVAIGVVGYSFVDNQSGEDTQYVHVDLDGRDMVQAAD